MPNENELIESIQNVDDNYLIIKFESSLKRSSIKNGSFQINELDGATPGTLIVDPFNPINISDDYNTISKTLTLYWKSNKIDPDTKYVLSIAGLQDALGRPLPSVTWEFKTSTAFESTTYEPPVEKPILIEDKSIKSNVFTESSIINVPNLGFWVESVYPLDGSAYLAEDENDGIIEITFSSSISSDFLTSTYFKTQKKEIKRGPSRWESIETEIEQDNNKPIVYVRLPANDGTPSYGVSGKTYFEPGYKYRVIVSKSVGA